MKYMLQGLKKLTC